MPRQFTTSRQQTGPDPVLCGCGCGQPTLLANHTVPSRGVRMGEPLRFIHGHHLHHSPGYNPPQWKGGRHLREDGYVLCYRPEHPRATSAGYVYEHMLVFEEAFGPIPEGLVIHHRNRVRSDNRPENLEALTQSEHMRLHMRLTRWAKSYDSCPLCHTTKRQHAAFGLCRRCYKREHRAA